MRQTTVSQLNNKKTKTGKCFHN